MFWFKLNHHQGAYSLCFAKVTILVSVKIHRYWTVQSCGYRVKQSLTLHSAWHTHTNRTGLICGHTTEQFSNEVF